MQITQSGHRRSWIMGGVAALSFLVLSSAIKAEDQPGLFDGSLPCITPLAGRETPVVRGQSPFEYRGYPGSLPPQRRSSSVRSQAMPRSMAWRSCTNASGS